MVSCALICLGGEAARIPSVCGTEALTSTPPPLQGGEKACLVALSSSVYSGADGRLALHAP